MHLGVPAVNKVVDSALVVDQFGREYTIIGKAPRFGRPVVVIPFVISVSEYDNTVYDSKGIIIDPGTRVGEGWYLWFGRTWPNHRRIFVTP
jgi:hypothetical protein